MATFPSSIGQRALHPFPELSSSSSSSSSSSKQTSDNDDIGAAGSRRAIANYGLPERLLEGGGGGASGSGAGRGASSSGNHHHHSSSNNSNNRHGSPDEGGIPVWKVSKNGKLQPRRVAFSQDKRNLLVTTRKLTYGLKGLWAKTATAVLSRTRSKQDGEEPHGHHQPPSSAPNGAAPPGSGSGGPVKVIPLEAVDRIERGTTSRRFLLARQEAQMSEQHDNHGSSNSGPHQSQISKWLTADDDPDQPSCCITIVYAVAYAGNDHYTQPFDTLDLVIPKSRDYEDLLTSLEDLVALHQDERQGYCGSLRLLRHHWCVTFGKPVSSPLSESEFLKLCERLQVPCKRAVLQILFKQELALLQGERRSDSGDCAGMPLEHAAYLLEDVRKSTLPKENLAFEKLWKDVRETDPVPRGRGTSGAGSNKQQSTAAAGAAGPISAAQKKRNKGFEHDTSMEDSSNDDDGDEEAAGAEHSILEDNNEEEEESISVVAFLSFLRSQQKEYATTLEEATDLVRVLNQQATPDDLVNARNQSHGGSNRRRTSADRLAKSRFLAFLTSDANDLMHPARGRVGADDMSRPLSHYWINTSHDTYMDSIPYTSLNGKSAYSKASKKSQSLDSVNEQSYGMALVRGVRCLELDLWDGLDRSEGPVVARTQPLTPNDKRLSVSAVLHVVRSFLHQNPYTFPILLKIENHCSTIGQQQLAQLLHQYLGKDGLIATPCLQHYDLDASVTLPSPEELRGKVVVIGKRPKKCIAGRKVRRDDFDAENDRYTDRPRIREDGALSFGSDGEDDDCLDDDDDTSGVVVGFNAKGPIRSQKSDSVARPSDELLQIATEEASYAQLLAKDAQERATELDEKALNDEGLAKHWTQRSGLTAGEVQRRAARVARGLSIDHDDVEEIYRNREEEKSTKEEGLEIHEILPGFLQGGKEEYQQLVQAAMDAAGREAQCHAVLLEKTEALRMARDNLEMARKREIDLNEGSRRAAMEARANYEDAQSAKARVEQVRELLRNSRDQSSSAGTVVQTALTESKISEQRAADAEARAARAASAAENERRRADEETRKEEVLEREVNALHDRCMEATEAAKAARERVEKAAAMLDRVNEQIRLIESTSQYRKESQERNGRSNHGAGQSFLTKHAAKMEEREMCRELIKEASEEHAAAESSRNKFQQQFEERAYQWKIQADVASQSRRTADRSTHVAEELAEHAEEEREAANLRHTARERAEATVENKDNYRSSIEAQLAQAERASAEATKLSEQSRKRADNLAKELERVRDHSIFQKSVHTLEIERSDAEAEYESAKRDREEKDKLMAEEKRRLDTNSEVYQIAAREAAAETDRVKIEHLYQEQAVTAYNQALKSRQEAKQAEEVAKSAIYKAEIKRLALDRAREYKMKSTILVDIPVDLARVTLIHTTKFQSWSKSFTLSNVQAHSFSQNVLLRMVDKSADEAIKGFQSFTKDHLVRVFPSWKAIVNKSVTNYDPVFGWSLGCQLVACNFHSTDESLLIAEGRFRQNGSCGYVLKPTYLTGSSPRVENDQRWSFQVLSGHHLPRPIRKAAGVCSPLVKISIYSGSAEETRISYRTRPARNAGLNPVWTSNNKFEFVIPRSSVSMICFSVWHAMDDGTENFMAASAFPASCLREGYRSIALFDDRHSRCGAHAPSVLLVKTMKR